MESLPLFPLGAVTLPGIVLPLRIFEPRYIAMVNRLAREDAPFGLIAIRRGDEVGDALPDLYRVGCSAVIGSADRVDDQLRIEAVTGRRFLVEAVHPDVAPYLVADVTWLESPTGEDVPADEITRAQEAFTAFTRTIGARVDGLSDDPARLTASILDGLGQPLPQQQAVLEAGGTRARLRAVTRMCRREEGLARLLQCRAARVTPSSRLSPN